MEIIAKSDKRWLLEIEGRIIETSEEEWLKVARLMIPYITKFGDLHKVMGEHKYLFKNCDPLWK